MSVLLETLTGLYARTCASEDIAQKHFHALKSDLLSLIVEEKDRIRHGWTRTGVSGCVSPPSLELSPDVADDEEYTTPADAHDSSAAIPQAVIEKLDRCAE